MRYMTLGSRPVKAVNDTTGMNSGNYTCVFDDSVINASTPVFEMYHMYLEAPSLVGMSTTAKVVLNTGSWDATLLGQLNSWDPSQPMLMTPGDTLYILFNVPVPNAKVPIATAWFRVEL